MNNFTNALENIKKGAEELEQYGKLGRIENLVREEDTIKFYYCESEDDYYIGKRVDTLYYAKHTETGFVWFMSRYLPWGQHVIAHDTLWKENKYPSEPKEIPFQKWLQGFMKKYFEVDIFKTSDGRIVEM